MGFPIDDLNNWLLHGHCCCAVLPCLVSLCADSVLFSHSDAISYEFVYHCERKWMCGKRACEKCQMRESHGQCERVGSPVSATVHFWFSAQLFLAEPLNQMGINCFSVHHKNKLCHNWLLILSQRIVESRQFLWESPLLCTVYATWHWISISTHH